MSEVFNSIAVASRNSKLLPNADNPRTVIAKLLHFYNATQSRKLWAKTPINIIIQIDIEI